MKNYYDDKIEWEQLCKRTNDPKLAWLEDELSYHGIANRKNGESWHAPILEVDKSKIDKAWEILDPIDDIPDDDERWLTISDISEWSH